jgi:peptide deformylase
MNVIHWPDPRLMQRTRRIEEFDGDLRAKAEQMFECMYAEGGVGLAAPQVAWSVRLFVMNASGKREDTPLERVVINPRILKRRGRVVGPEGCLSFPGLYVDVERARSIVVEYFDLDGQRQEERLGDFEARVFQHELDHLDNVLLVHRMTQADAVRHKDAIDKLRRDFQPIG